MGQGKSKQPMRIVVASAQDQVNDVNDISDEDDINNNIDTLGIVSEETHYPAPKPPPKRATSSVPSSAVNGTRNPPYQDTVNTENEPQESIVNSDEASNSTRYEVQLVPVGASFQKFFKRTAEIDFADMEFYDKTRNHQLGKVSAEYTPRLVTLSRSVSNSTNASASDLSRIGVHKPSSSMAKGESMLANRELYESQRGTRAQTPSGSIRSTKGQVRRFNFYSIRDPMASFQTVEDTLANEISEKHRDHRAETYSSVTHDLTSEVTTERLKVKVILSWISKQNIGQLQFMPKAPHPDTPNGYMMLIQNGQGTYPVFFALLCRAAGIKCAIVSGISKGSNYEVGSTNTKALRNTWNAVFVDETWQLVHPLWVCRGLSRRQKSGWVTIEREGKAKRERSTTMTGRDVNTFNNYFIFTRPDEFIYRNFPDDPKWQLLEKPLSEEDFMNLSYIRPCFFQSHFKLLSSDKCILTSENGEPIEIVIGFKKEDYADIVFGYEFKVKIEEEQLEAVAENGENVDTKTESPPDDENGRYVIVRKEERRVIFEVRFLKTGLFKLKLYGGSFTHYGNKPPWLMDVQVVCQAVLPQVDPLPFDPGSIGWGPGPVLQDFGIFVPSHIESVVMVSQTETENLYFVLQQPQDIIVELLHSEKSRESLSEFVNAEIEHMNDIYFLKVQITYPGKGEYAMRIDVRKRNRLFNACNYIVHTRRERPHEPFYHRKARRMVLEAMTGCDVEVMERALMACEQYGLSDSDPEVVGARNRHEFLCCRKELHVAMLVHRIDVAEHALYRTRRANLDVLLGKEVRRVEAHLAFLLQLDEGGWTADIPDIDRLSLVELSQLRSPRTEIRLLVIAMYMILGVDELFLQDWANVRRLLRDQEATLVEMARLEKYLELELDGDELVVERDVLATVERLIGRYTEDDIRKVDNTAAAFFRWVHSVVEIVKQKHQARDAELEKAKVYSRKPTPFRRESLHMASRPSDSKRGSLLSENNPLPTSSKTLRSQTLRDSHSEMMRSRSGKVMVQRHPSNPLRSMQASASGDDIAISRRGTTRASLQDRLQTPGALSLRSEIIMSREESDLGALTPLPVSRIQQRDRPRLVTARPENRLLTARASALNSRQEPSRLLTAASGVRGSNFDLKSIKESTPSLSKGRTLRSIAGSAKHNSNGPQINGGIPPSNGLPESRAGQVKSSTSVRHNDPGTDNRLSMKARNGTITLSESVTGV